MAKRTPNEAEPLSRRASAAADIGVDGIRECIVHLRKRLKSAYDEELASDLALMTHKAAQIMSEARKMESHEAKYSELDPVAVLEWLRTKQTPAQRAQWVKDIQALDRKVSVLG
jgi:hypothetical protein